MDDAVIEAVSYYQSVDQLNKIPWSLPRSWALKGPKGLKKACGHFCSCGFVTYKIMNGEQDTSAPFSSFELGILRHLKVERS